MSEWHEQDWQVARGPIDGDAENAEIIISYATGFGGENINETWPQLVIVKVVPRDNDMTLPELEDLEDKIDELLEQADIGMLIAKVTILDTESFREHILYVEEDVDLQAFCQSLIPVVPNCEAHFEVDMDRDWTFYTNLVGM